ncbi:MAG: hydroxypyruvate isomerase [Geminicoccaceae bacterium]
MPKFCANLTLLYTEQDFMSRFEAAARSGFKGVEYLFPYGFDKDRLAEQLAVHGLTHVLHNLPAGDWDAGERGIACLPDRVGEFQDGVGRAIEYATALGCKQLNCLVGIKPGSVDDEKATSVVIDNLRFAAPKLADAGIKLLLEAANTRDIPGFFVNRSAQAIDIIDAAGSDNIYLQHDFYHMQIMEGDLAPTFAQLKDRVAHIQVADNPGRHEPGTGEIAYPFLFDWLDKQGYAGWIGCEYKPKTTTEEGLGWLKPYRKSASAP